MAETRVGNSPTRSQDHRYVVRAEAPEGVLVLPDLAQVHALRVEVADRTQLASLQELAQLVDRGMVDEEVADHEREPAAIGELDQVRCLARRLGERLLHKDVLPGLEGGAGQHVVGGGIGGDRDRFDRGVAEDLVGVGLGAGVGVSGAERRQGFGATVADRRELTGAGEVPEQVPAPVAGSDHADPDRAARLSTGRRDGSG